MRRCSCGRDRKEDEHFRIELVAAILLLGGHQLDETVLESWLVDDRGDILLPLRKGVMASVIIRLLRWKVVRFEILRSIVESPSGSSRKRGQCSTLPVW